MRASTLLLSLVILLALAGCSGAPTAAADASATPERLYRSKCSACHRAYPPESRTRAQWEHVLPQMAARAHLRDDEQEMLQAWLHDHAKDAAPGAGGSR